MPAPRRTQKQISNRYQGNLGYFARFHFGRVAKLLVTLLAAAAGLAAIIAFQKRGDERFFNPGRLSRSHAALAKNCSSCHDKSLPANRGLTAVGFQEVLRDRFRHGVTFDPIDENCERCHFKQERRSYKLHQSNVVKNRSCSLCHPEHQGLASLTMVASSQCAACHNNAQVMAASADKGMQLPWTRFQRHPHPAQQIVFDLPRPARGYTQTFAAFWNGHPEFQLKRESVRDPDVLKFNHARHFAADIPPVNGRKLDCSYCHQRDAAGRYNIRLSFAGQCQACHSLQFDPRNPELTLPHGNTTMVRGFLRSLPSQYADLAVKKGIREPYQIRRFVTAQMSQLRDHLRVTYPAIPASLAAIGDAFEYQVFFVADPYKLRPGAEARVRASFYGCALCHEVQPVANTAPSIAKPLFVDRWMPQASFDHTKHRMVKCDDCHHATVSHLTSDVLMPGIASCVTCHSPKGKVVAECITCHTYHAPAGLMVAEEENAQPSTFNAQRSVLNVQR